MNLIKENYKETGKNLYSKSDLWASIELSHDRPLSLFIRGLNVNLFKNMHHANIISTETLKLDFDTGLL